VLTVRKRPGGDQVFEAQMDQLELSADLQLELEVGRKWCFRTAHRELWAGCGYEQKPGSLPWVAVALDSREDHEIWLAAFTTRTVTLTRVSRVPL
jgi:hypothetical protein